MTVISAELFTFVTSVVGISKYVNCKPSNLEIVPNHFREHFKDTLFICRSHAVIETAYTIDLQKQQLNLLNWCK